jgi:thioredoxin-like negative regulator of GroEL
MTRDDFLNKVCNYVASQEWKFLGETPCLIDFYDDACPPCKAVEPILEGLLKEFGDRVDFFKVDTRKEEELSRELGIKYMPTLVLCPIDNKPIVLQGVPTREKLAESIEKELLGKKI